MERQNEPLAQQKPWEEMTEEERQVVRESWKHTLPENFDVFFNEGSNFPYQDLVIPGNAYVATFLDIGDITVDGDFVVDEDINCANVTVHGCFITKGIVDCLEVNVDDLFDCYNVESWGSPIEATDFVCRRYEEKNN